MLFFNRKLEEHLRAQVSPSRSSLQTGPLDICADLSELELPDQRPGLPPGPTKPCGLSRRTDPFGLKPWLAKAGQRGIRLCGKFVLKFKNQSVVGILSHIAKEEFEDGGGVNTLKLSKITPQQFHWSSLLVEDKLRHIKNFWGVFEGTWNRFGPCQPEVVRSTRPAAGAGDKSFLEKMGSPNLIGYSFIGCLWKKPRWLLVMGCP